MAIAPNTTFVSGAVLTAAQMNALPWGVVALTKVTSNQTIDSTAVIAVTASTFTAVANRYYRITYFEPQVPQVQNNNSVSLFINLTNTAGAIYGSAVQINTTAVSGAANAVTLVAVTTLTAGSTVLVGTAVSPGASVSMVRNANQPAYILVEDIGPA